MAEIQIEIESYGAVERLIPKDLILLCNENNSVAEVLKQISDQFPDCLSILDRCACAIGDEIIPRHQRLNSHCTLVLLSPVAGG